MTELLHLMNAVANQGSGSEGRKWQHPSDLTRRYTDAVGGEGQVDWYVWVGTKTNRNSLQTANYINIINGDFYNHGLKIHIYYGVIR